MKLTAMCGVVVDVFAGAFRRQCDNHGNLLAVHDIAETWKQSTATGILKVLPLDFLSNIIPVVRLHITFLFTYLCVAAAPSSLGSVKEVDIPKHVVGLKMIRSCLLVYCSRSCRSTASSSTSRDS